MISKTKNIPIIVNNNFVGIFICSEKNMDKKMVIGTRKENIAVVIAGAIIAIGVFYVVKNPGLFTASVLSLQEKAFIIEKWRDIAYKTESGYVDIFMSEKIATPAKIDFTVSFDKENITIDPQNLSGQATRTIEHPDESNIIIHAVPNQTIDKSKSLVLLPFSGNKEDILVSEAVAKLNDGTDKNLSIGSINITTSHSK